MQILFTPPAWSVLHPWVALLQQEDPVEPSTAEPREPLRLRTAIRYVYPYGHVVLSCCHACEPRHDRDGQTAHDACA